MFRSDHRLEPFAQVEALEVAKVTQEVLPWQVSADLQGMTIGFDNMSLFAFSLPDHTDGIKQSSIDAASGYNHNWFTYQ